MESAAKRATASTFFDTLDPATFAGTRAATNARHLVLRAEAFDIHVKIWGEPPRREMAGQILARGAAVPVSGARLQLLRNGERLATTTADNLGEFSLSDVPEGSLSLQLDLPQLTVVGALNLDG